MPDLKLCFYGLWESVKWHNKFFIYSKHVFNPRLQRALQSSRNNKKKIALKEIQKKEDNGGLYTEILKAQFSPLNITMLNQIYYILADL